MNRDSNSPFITHSSFTSLNQIVQQVHQVQATTSQARSGVCIQRLIVLSPLYFHKPLHSRSSRYKQSQGITPRSDWDYLVCTPLYSLKDRVVIHHCWEIAQFAFNPLSLVSSLGHFHSSSSLSKQKRVWRWYQASLLPLHYTLQQIPFTRELLQTLPLLLQFSLELSLLLLPPRLLRQVDQCMRVQ